MTLQDHSFIKNLPQSWSYNILSALLENKQAISISLNKIATTLLNEGLSMHFFNHIIMILFFVTNISSLIHPVTVKDLKDTDAILNDNYKQCSLVPGGLWWESNLLKKYYDFGDSTHASIKLIQDLFHVVQGSFSITNNKSYPTGHFNVTTVANIIGTIETSKSLSKDDLKKALTDAITDEDFNKSCDKTGVDYARISTEIQAHVAISVGLKKKIKDVENIFKSLDLRRLFQDKKAPSPSAMTTEYLDSKIAEFDAKADKPKDLPKIKALSDTAKKITGSMSSTQMNEALAATNKEIETLKKNGADNNASKAKARIADFVTHIVDSLEECGYRTSTKKPDYFPFTTHTILLGFLYRKAVDKTGLKAYFDTLLDYIDADKLLSPQGLTFLNADGVVDEKKWEPVYTASVPVAIAIKDALEKTRDEKEPLNRLKNILDGISYENLMYAAIVDHYYSNPLPKIDSHQNVTFENITFADCVETTMRMLCNFILYSQRNTSFALSNIGPDVQIDKLAVDKKLADFFEIHKNPLQLSANATHQAWVDVVENRPFVAYNRIVDEKKQETIGSEFVHGITIDDVKKKLSETPGSTAKISEQMIIPSHTPFSKISINNNNFTVVDAREYKTYELQPTIKNIIILLNQLFSLKLYTNPLEPFINQTFNATYFPELCTKLGWEYTISDDKNLDARDYGATEFILPLTMASQCKGISPTKCQITLSLQRGHGEIRKPSGEQTKEAYEKELLSLLFSAAQDVSFFSKQYVAMQCLNLLVLYANGDEKIISSTIKTTPMLGYHLAYFQDLDNHNEKLKIIELILSEKNESLYFLAARLINALPVLEDLIYQRHMIDIIKKNQEACTNKDIYEAIKKVFHDVGTRNNMVSYKAIIEFESSEEKLTDLINPIMRKIITVAQKGLSSSDISTAYQSSDLCLALLRSNKSFDDQFYRDIIKYAQDNFNRDDDSRGNICDIFNALLKRNKGFDEALKKEIYEAIKRVFNDVGTRNNMDSYQAIIKIESSEEKLEEKLTDLINTIMRKIITVAQKDLSSSDISTAYQSSDLCLALLRSNKSFDDQFYRDIIKYAQANFNRDDYRRGNICNIFNALIKRNKGFDEALKIALDNIRVGEYNKYENDALSLLLAIVESGNKQFYKNVIKAAQDYFSMHMMTERGPGVDLFDSLIKRFKLLAPGEDETLETISKPGNKSSFIYPGFYEEALKKLGKFAEAHNWFKEEEKEETNAPSREEKTIELPVA